MSTARTRHQQNYNLSNVKESQPNVIRDFVGITILLIALCVGACIFVSVQNEPRTSFDKSHSLVQAQVTDRISDGSYVELKYSYTYKNQSYTDSLFESIDSRYGSLVSGDTLDIYVVKDSPNQTELAENRPEGFPKGLTAWIIVGTIVLIVATGVILVVQQYKMLKNTFRNLEQGLQQGAQYAQQIDFVEYPQNYGGYPNQYNPQQYNDGYTNQNVQSINNSVTQNRQPKRSLGVVGIVIYTLSIGFLLVSFMHLMNYGNIFEMDRISAEVVSCQQMTFSPEDEDDANIIEYRLEVAYEYNGEQYESEVRSTSLKFEGEIIPVYADPNNPTKLVYAETYILQIKLAVGAIALFVIINIIRKAIYAGTQNSSRPARQNSVLSGVVLFITLSILLIRIAYFYMKFGGNF